MVCTTGVLAIFPWNWYFREYCRSEMSSLNRNSSAEFPVDLKHVVHVWRILNSSRFSSTTFGLQSLKGRRNAVASLMSRSYKCVKDWTTNWTLEGPEEVPPEAAESQGDSVDIDLEAAILEPIVRMNIIVNGPGRKSLITPTEYDIVRDIIHTMYKSKAYVTLKTLLVPVQEKLQKKVWKSVLYRVLRRMGFKYQ